MNNTTHTSSSHGAPSSHDKLQRIHTAKGQAPQHTRATPPHRTAVCLGTDGSTTAATTSATRSTSLCERGVASGASASGCVAETSRHSRTLATRPAPSRWPVADSASPCTAACTGREQQSTDAATAMHSNTVAGGAIVSTFNVTCGRVTCCCCCHTADDLMYADDAGACFNYSTVTSLGSPRPPAFTSRSSSAGVMSTTCTNTQCSQSEERSACVCCVCMCVCMYMCMCMCVCV
jgi:hypothetical protein